MFVAEGNKIVTLYGDVVFLVGKTYDVEFEDGKEYVTLENGEKRYWTSCANFKDGNGEFKSRGWKKIKFRPTDNNIILIENAE